MGIANDLVVSKMIYLFDVGQGRFLLRLGLRKLVERKETYGYTEAIEVESKVMEWTSLQQLY